MTPSDFEWPPEGITASGHTKGLVTAAGQHGNALSACPSSLESPRRTISTGHDARRPRLLSDKLPERLSMGIENGSGATGAGQRAGSRAGLMTRAPGSGSGVLFGGQPADGSPSRARRGAARGSYSPDVDDVAAGPLDAGVSGLQEPFPLGHSDPVSSDAQLQASDMAGPGDQTLLSKNRSPGSCWSTARGASMVLASPSALPATMSNRGSLSSTECSGGPIMIVARQRRSFPAFCEELTMPRIEIDRVKDILITLEDSYPDWRGIDLGIEDDRLRSYYVDFLRKDGLVEANNWGTDQTGDDWKATGLTPDGHRMAEALRAAPANWHERALQSVKAEGWSLTWEMAKKYLWQLIG